MAAGPVNRAALEANYQNSGDVYSDLDTEACFEVVANQVDENYYYTAGLINAGVLQRLGYYIVSDYGLVGNGTTDDTNALQTLINTAVAAGRRAIYFPHTVSGGVYKVTALTNADQVDFFGDNASFTGGYTGTINQLGDWASSAQLADTTRQANNPLIGEYKTVKDDDQYNCWPVLVKTTTGRIIVFYGSGSHHQLGDVYGRKLCYKYSDSDGLSWSDEYEMLYDPAYDYTTFGAVAVSDGTIICFANKYDGITTREHLVMRSADDGLTFSEVFNFADSTDPIVQSRGFPSIPVEMDNGVLVAGKQSYVDDMYGLYFIFSEDKGLTWNTSVEAVAPIYASVSEIPWEVRIAELGGGKLLAIGRNDQGNPYQITSEDYGETWLVTGTNIADCESNNLYPLYIPVDDSIALYYNNRDDNTINRRTVLVDDILSNPYGWPEPQVVGHTSSPSTAIDAGYLSSCTLNSTSRSTITAMYTTRGDEATDDTSERKTAIVILYDHADNPNVNTSVALASRQALINADFDRWSRGTSFSASSYTADRWRIIKGSGSTVVLSRGSFAVGQSDVPNEPIYYAEIEISAIGSGSTFFVQRIEDVRSFAGKTISYSFYAKCASGSYEMQVYATQNFGSGGSSGVSTSQDNHRLTTSWRKFSGTAVIPGISGKTIGGNSYLEISFRFGVDSGTDTIDLSQVQVNEGPNLLSFQKRNYAEEQSLCERYCTAYVSSSANHAVGEGIAISTTQARIQVHLPTSMRSIPTLQVTVDDWWLSDGVSTSTPTDISILTAQTSERIVTLLCTVASGLTQFRPYQLIADGTANRLMLFEAEL